MHVEYRGMSADWGQVCILFGVRNANGAQGEVGFIGSLGANPKVVPEDMAGALKCLFCDDVDALGLDYEETERACAEALTNRFRDVGGLVGAIKAQRPCAVSLGNLA